MKIGFFAIYIFIYFSLIFTQWGHISLVEALAIAAFFLLSKSMLFSFSFDDETTWGYGYIPAGVKKNIFARCAGIIMAVIFLIGGCIVAIWIY